MSSPLINILYAWSHMKKRNEAKGLVRLLTSMMCGLSWKKD